MGTGDGKQNKILFPISKRIILLLTQIVLQAGVDMDNNEKKTVTLNDWFGESQNVMFSN
jgi:hypothetical protein